MVVNQKTELEKASTEEISIDGFDHIEFYVGNALQACYYYHKGFGFDVVAHKGLETGDRDISSYVLRQNNVTLVLTSGLSPDHPITQHVRQHGDGVKTIAFKVRDAKKCFATATARGAKKVNEPQETQDKDGAFIAAAVKTYGDTVHTFVERQNYQGIFAPGYQPFTRKSENPGLLYVDHVVGNVEVDRLESWVDSIGTGWAGSITKRLEYTLTGITFDAPF